MNIQKIEIPEENIDLIEVCKCLFYTLKHFDIKDLRYKNRNLLYASPLNNNDKNESLSVDIENGDQAVKYKGYDLLPVNVTASFVNFGGADDVSKVSNKNNFVHQIDNNLIPNFKAFLNKAGYSSLYKNSGKNNPVNDTPAVNFGVFKVKDTDNFVIRADDEIIGIHFSSISDSCAMISIVYKDNIFIFSSDSFWTDFRQPNRSDCDFYFDNLDSNIDEATILKGEYAEIVDEHETSFKLNQDDPFISEDELEGLPCEFVCGSEEQLAADISLLFHACVPSHLWQAAGRSEINLEIRASDGDESAYIDYEGMEWNGDDFNDLINKNHKHINVEAFKSALDKIIERNEPQGYTWEYNDGAHDRKSGYDRSTIRLDIEVAAPSAHETICARLKLKDMSHIFSKDTINKLLNDTD